MLDLFWISSTLMVVGRTGNSRLWDLAARHLAEWTPRKLRFTYPNDKRKYGYYVLPILHEGKVVGRVDPLMDRAKGVLHIHRVHAEPGAPMNRKTDKAIAQAIAELGAFLSARHINIENKA
jgi:hypothetical protein